MLKAIIYRRTLELIRSITISLSGTEKKYYILIQRYILLSVPEAMAIRWHMGFSEPKENWNVERPQSGYRKISGRAGNSRSSSGSI